MKNDFITLTQDDGDPIEVNLTKITYLHNRGVDKGVVVMFSKQFGIFVKESTKEILEMMEEKN